MGFVQRCASSTELLLAWVLVLLIAACGSEGDAQRRPTPATSGGGAAPDTRTTVDPLVDQSPNATRSVTGEMKTVIVDLAIPWEPEAELASAEAVAGQRAEIAAIQGEVLQLLEGTQFVSLRLYEITPQMALAVDATALDRLHDSELVAGVAEDVPDPSSG